MKNFESCAAATFELRKRKSWPGDTTLIPANEAAAPVGEYATVEGVVAKVFTSKAGNTFPNSGVEIYELRPIWSVNSSLVSDNIE